MNDAVKTCKFMSDLTGPYLSLQSAVDLQKQVSQLSAETGTWAARGRDGARRRTAGQQEGEGQRYYRGLREQGIHRRRGWRGSGLCVVGAALSLSAQRPTGPDMCVDTYIQAVVVHSF